MTADWTVATSAQNKHNLVKPLWKRMCKTFLGLRVKSWPSQKSFNFLYKLDWSKAVLTKRFPPKHSPHVDSILPNLSHGSLYIHNWAWHPSDDNRTISCQAWARLEKTNYVIQMNEKSMNGSLKVLIAWFVVTAKEKSNGKNGSINIAWAQYLKSSILLNIAFL